MNASSDRVTQLRERLDSRAQPRALPLKWLQELKNTPPPPQVVKGLLPAGGLVVLYGEPSAGKSWLALDLALHVASGEPWRGLRVQGGVVVYIAAEGARGLERRAHGYRLHKKELAGARLGIVGQPLDLGSSDAGVQALIQAVKHAEPEQGETCSLIVIDTLSRVIAGDENNPRDMGALIANLDCLRAATSACVLLVHHAGKDVAKGARGHSSLRGAVDVEIFVETQGNQRIATVKKSRDYEDGQRYGFELKVVPMGEDEDGLPVSSCVVRHVEAAAVSRKRPSGRQQVAVLRLMEAETKADNPVLTTGALVKLAQERLRIAKSSARSAVLGLTNAGFLIATVGGVRLAENPDE